MHTYSGRKQHLVILLALIFLAALSRCVPHMLNFSPLGAICLFSAAYAGRKWQAFAIPIAATWLSDLFINNVIYPEYHPAFTWISPGFYAVYLSYLLISLASLGILRKVTVPRVIAGVLSSTAIFFIVTNFAAWKELPVTYPQNFNGLMQAYVAGIPFIKGTLLGDAFYSAVLFGGFALLVSGRRRSAEARPLRAASVNR